MADSGDQKLALFQLYLATAEKVSDRRAQANSWMLSVNSAIVGLYGYLQADKIAAGAAQKAIWLWGIPAAGAIVCAAWAALLASYRELNRAKFAVLAQGFKRYAAHDSEAFRIAMGRREHHVVPVSLPGGRHKDRARHAGRIHFF
jgi:hypothetical protein